MKSPVSVFGSSARITISSIRFSAPASNFRMRNKASISESSFWTFTKEGWGFNMEHIFEIKQWASSGKAATEVVKTGALYQDKNTQLKLQAQIDTLQSV